METLYTPENIKEIIQDLDIVSSNQNTPDKRTVVERIGSIRPDMDDIDKQLRHLLLEEKRYTAEHWSRKPMPIEYLIVPSEKELSEDLELQPIILSRIIIAEDWKALVVRDQLPDKFEAALDLGDFNNYINALISELSNTLSEDDFLDIVAASIYKEVTAQASKFDTYKHGNLKTGLELEVYDADSSESASSQFKQIKEIDALQEIGLGVIYDGMREIPLPKSLSSTEQLKAILELIKGGFIHKDQYIGIHFNVEGIEVSSDLFVLDQIMRSANIFNVGILHGTILSPPENMNKPLYETDSSSPIGLPFRVRHTGVLEFRWLPSLGDYAAQSDFYKQITAGVKGAANFNDYVRGIETLSLVLETLGGYQRLQNGKSKDQSKDAKLAEAWLALKANTLKTFGDMGIPANDVDRFYDNYVDYTVHLGKITDRVATDKLRYHSDDQGILVAKDAALLERTAENRKAMYKHVLQARRTAREIIES